jgi:iron complex outermembrane receptor protein
MGGAVQLVTRMDGTHDSLLSGADASASAGSFDTKREAISLWLKPGRFRFFGHGTHEKSAGDFEFVDDNGTRDNPDDDQTTVRGNNDFNAWSGILRGSAEIPGVGTALFGYYDAARENGVPGLGSNQSASARSERRRRLGQLRFDGAPFFDERLTWSAAGYYHRANEQFHDPDGEIALIGQETDNTINAYGGTARLKYLIPGNRFSVEADGSATTEQFHPVEKLPELRNGPDRWRRSVMIALGGDAYLIGQALVVSGLVRFEQHADEFGNETIYPWLPPSAEGRFEHETTSPSMGARWHALSWLTFKGNIGRYYRLPTFLELFGNIGSVTGNAALEPEEGVNRDIGLTVNVARAGFARSLFAEVSYFDNTVDNLILFFPNSQWTSKPTNIGAAHIRGIESSVSAVVPYGFELAAAYTYLHTEDTGGIPTYRGNQLPSRPPHDVNASLSYSWRALRATYELQFISANYLDRYNARATAARSLHALILVLRAPVDGLSLTLEGRNLTDERVEDVAGFPLPGRSVYSTLGYRY